MIPAAVAVATGAWCAVLAYRRWYRIHTSEEPRLATDGLAKELDHDTTRGVSELVTATRSAATSEHAIAEINDRLREVEHELDRDRAAVRSVPRVALLVGALCALVEILAQRDLWGAVSAVVAVVAGATGAAVSVYLGRAADSESAARREQWNRVARRVERWVESGAWRGDPRAEAKPAPR